MLRLGLDAQPAKSEPSKGDTNTGLSRWRFCGPTDDLDPVDLADTRQRAEALADTEYAVRAERAVSRVGASRSIHIGTSTLLYALLLLHI